MIQTVFQLPHWLDCVLEIPHGKKEADDPCLSNSICFCKITLSLFYKPVPGLESIQTKYRQSKGFYSTYIVEFQLFLMMKHLQRCSKFPQAFHNMKPLCRGRMVASFCHSVSLWSRRVGGTFRLEAGLRLESSGASDNS